MLKWEKAIELTGTKIKLWYYFILPLNRLSNAYGLFCVPLTALINIKMSVIRRNIFLELFPGLFHYFSVVRRNIFRAIIMLFSVLLPFLFRYSSRHFYSVIYVILLISAFNSLKPFYSYTTFHFVFVSIVLFCYAHWLSPFSCLL